MLQVPIFPEIHHKIDPEGFTATELLSVLSSRLLTDGQIVFAGVGIPLLSVGLAQRINCPGLTILFEGGALGPYLNPSRLPTSPNEQRSAERANMVMGITDVMLLLQRGYVDVGFMGGAQIDQYGNLNSSFIGDPESPRIRLPGSGGGNDIASLTQLIVAMKHERRRFVEKVAFVTSPGFLNGGSDRERRGLLAGGMYRVVTNLAIMSFDRTTREIKVDSLCAGVTPEEIRDNTGFDIRIDDCVGLLPAPTAQELEILRNLDPDQMYTA